MCGLVYDDMASDLGDAPNFGVTSAGKSSFENGVAGKRQTHQLTVLLPKDRTGVWIFIRNHP